MTKFNIDKLLVKSPTKKKSIPFNFVLDHLEFCDPMIKPMFGCHALYVAAKIVLILRDRESYPEDNGVWLATTQEHHAGLKKEFPYMRSLTLFGKGPTGWQNLPADSPDFEEAVTRACELITKNDPRIGKIPKPKSLNKKSSKRERR